MSTNSDSGVTGEGNADKVDTEANSEEGSLRWRECLETAIRYFHDQIDQPIQDHTEDGRHSERATTAREYFHDRGWDDETIENHLLGWSPPGSENSLEAHLAIQGYTKEELLATGLFKKSGEPLWQGRYVFTYLDGDSQPVYAASRCTGGKGGGGGETDYGGHPADFLDGKYAKLAHNKDYSRVSEPIFGKGTIRDGEPVIITEGVADAITIQEAGYACLSPVTTQFSRSNQQALLVLLEAHTVPEVYVLQDAERPSVDYDQDSDELETDQFGPGVKGAVKTASLLTENGVDAYVNTPPRLGLGKVDVDDYIQDGWGTLDTLLRSAKPPRQHPAYTDEQQSDLSAPSSLQEGSPEHDGTGRQSGLFELNITDVTGLRQDYRGMNPLGHTGDSENYFLLINSRWAYDHKRKVGYNPLTYLLCDAGERPVDNPHGQLSERDRFVAWKHAKQNGLLTEDDPIPHGGLIHIAVEHDLCDRADIENGWRIPSEAYNTALEVVRDEYGLEPCREPYDGTQPAENLNQSPVVPDSRSNASSMTIDDARNRCQEKISQALAESQHSLIDALPGQGKSRGVIEWAAENDMPLTVLAPRRELLSDEYAGWCDDLGLNYYSLPALHRDCPCALGDHNEGWKRRVLGLYEAEVSPKEIHEMAELRYGHPLPCQRDGECPYMSKRKIDPANYDVLLGYYSHSYQEDIVDGRVVVMDETPSDAFIREFQHDKVVQVVSHYLSQKDDIPFDNYGELTSDKISRYRRGDARKWFQAHEQEIQREGFPVMTDETGQSHAFAPLMTYALLVADDLGNGWEYTTLPEGGVAVRNRDPSKEHDESELCFLMPPSLEDAEGVIGLDGTPWQKQWELCLGTSLTHYPVLDDDERQAYLQDVLDLTIFQIGTAAKPYSSGKWVKPDDDATLFEYIGKEQRRLPDLISSERAISQYDDADILELVGESEYYGNFKGSNKFEHSRVGAVVGSPHYGDTYVEKWGAFANEAVERLSDDGGMDLDYSSFGDKILQDMRESEVLQALLRFGRDGDGTVIYVFTAALPDWVPVADTGIVKKWSPGMRQLRTVLRNRDGDEWRTSDLVVDVGGRSVLDTAAPDPISKRQVRRNLNRLADVGFIDKRTEGCGAVWEDAGIASMNGKREVLFRG